MYKIVASDMDETFLAHDHSIPAANIEAIRRMRARGCLFVPASGRGYASILKTLEGLPPELLEDSYVISYNGSCINKVGDPKPLTSTQLPFEIVERLFAYGLDHNVSFHIYEMAGTVWAWNMQAEERAYLDGHMAYSEMEGPSVEFLRNVALSKMLYCIPNGLDELHHILDDMPQELLAGTSTTFSSKRYLEFNPEGVDKGTGLRTLAQMLNVPIEQTIACGDSLNDLPMIEVAGVGVAAANCTDHIDKKAQYLCKADCDAGVIAEVVDHFFPGC